MKNFAKIITLLSLLNLATAWVHQSQTTDKLKSLLPPNTSNFTAANSYTNDFIVIYGGNNGSANFDRTYIIYLTNATSQEIITSTRPSNLINSCGIVWQDGFYLYGEANNSNNNLTSNQFWKLNLTTRTWYSLSKAMKSLRICSVQMFEHNNMLLFGANYQNLLDVQLFYLNTSAFKPVTVQFRSHVIAQVQQWDGSKVDVQIPVQAAPTNGKQFHSKQFPISSRQRFQISNSRNQTKKLLQINGRVYSLYFDALQNRLQIQFVCSDGQFEILAYTSSVSLQDLTIFCFYQPQTKHFYMKYRNKALSKNFRVDNNTPNFYSETWPNFTSSSGPFSLFIVNQITSSYILMIIHQTYAVYTLNQDVYNSANPKGLKITTFGVNQCQSGYRGRNCNETSCPNSLYINSADQLRVIQSECSDNGICKNGSCRCNDIWHGDDCSIYLRKSCQGNLINNFPLMNCECANATRGGNNCTVKFCPNNCTQHGECKDGNCICDTNYFGADCSIMIIGISS